MKKKSSRRKDAPRRLKERYNLTLADDVAEGLSKIGMGNRSEAVERLYRAYQRKPFSLE